MIEKTVEAFSKDVTLSNKKTVACDGKGGALGHPRVYLSLQQKKTTVCPYCSRRFQFSEKI